MKKQLRMVGSIFILAGVIGWVALSYLPPGVVVLPQLGFPVQWTGQAFTWLALGSFVVFVALQVWIVQTTAAAVRRHRAQAAAAGDSGFDLSIGTEVVLTALPIILIVVLAFVSLGGRS